MTLTKEGVLLQELLPRLSKKWKLSFFAIPALLEINYLRDREID